MRKFVSILILILSAVSAGANPPREKISMDFDWRFHLGDAPDSGRKLDYPEVSDLAKTRGNEVGKEGNLAMTMPDPPLEDLGEDVSFVQPDFDDSGWRALDLPHDWAVELPFTDIGNSKELVSHGFKPIGPQFSANNIGWYRRKFELPESDRGNVLWLEFDGIYRNSLVWLNGHCLGRHLDGYSSFRYDISKYAHYGEENELVVRVDASRYEGWFYEGAGIYRHVWLEKTGPVAVAPDGTFVFSQFTNNIPGGSAQIHVETQLQNFTGNAVDASVAWQILDPEGNVVATAEQTARVHSRDASTVRQMTIVSHPELWSPESPKLYRLVTTIESGRQVVDEMETEFGVRSLAFDPDRGLLLNGKPYTIKGTCNHQDHAGVGTAVPDALQYYRLERLKEMGCNAVRTSHNPAAPALLQACDRLGLLVMEENRRMDTNTNTLDDLKGMILRDRNHPSIFVWSLGNEEPYLQGTNTGARVVAIMQNVVSTLDPTRFCTVAMNGKWGKGFSTVIDVQGFNYGTRNIDDYHAQHPAQPEIGTETASTVTTRGIYADDQVRGYVSAYGDEFPHWGSSPWEWWPYYSTHPFTTGGFVWSGFDYRGEPTPYKWPCINSHFGLMDTCGFPKDIYYYYQAWWTDKPMLHIMPHWNWPDKVGQEIPVRVFSNCSAVELFLNGKSLGRQKMRPNGYLEWPVIYEPGTLSASGYGEDGELVVETKVVTTGEPAAIRLSPDRTVIEADGQDVVVVNVSVIDSQGRVVPTADNLMHFQVKGAGKIIGVGNGDPSSHEADKGDERKIFNGYAQVIVQSDRQPGTIQLTADSGELQTALLAIKSKRGPGVVDYSFAASKTIR